MTDPLEQEPRDRRKLIEEILARLRRQREESQHEGERFRAQMAAIEAEKEAIRREVEIRIAVYNELQQRGLATRIRSWLLGGP